MGTFMELIEAWLKTHGVRLVLIGVFTVMALIFVRLISRRVVSAFKKSKTDPEVRKRVETVGTMLSYALTMVVLLVAAMPVMDQFGLRLGPMLAAAGVAGIAIGFGAQDLVRDITNGFFIMLDDEIRVGDIVEAGGKAGLVERVTLRMTVLRDLNGDVYYIPNSKIGLVTNMTKSFSYCLIRIGVAYRENVDEVMRVMTETAEGLKTDPEMGPWLLEPMEMLGVDEFADSAVIILARLKVKPIRQWKVKREYLRRLKHAFDKNGIEIPYPHMTVYAGSSKFSETACFPIQVVPGS